MFIAVIVKISLAELTAEEFLGVNPRNTTVLTYREYQKAV